jgi:hypothetical protein
MANTYTLISSVTVGSGGTCNIEFTSIPATYTDLVHLFICRNDSSANAITIWYFNGERLVITTAKRFMGDGTAAESTQYTQVIAAMFGNCNC